MSLLAGFYVGLFEEGDKKKCFSDSCAMLLHRMCEESMPGRTWIYFLPPAANGLSTTLAMEKICFSNLFSKYDI